MKRIERGQELATPGHLRPSRLLTVQVRAVDGTRAADQKPQSRARPRGYRRIAGHSRAARHRRLGAGQTAWAQLHLAAPAVTTWSQPFVIRSESPVQTIGGGIVLVPEAERLRRGEPEPLAHLAPSPVRPAAGTGRRRPVLRRTARLAAGRPGADGRHRGTRRTVTDALRAQGVLLRSGRVSHPDAPLPPRRAGTTAAIASKRALEKLHQQHPLRTVPATGSRFGRGFAYVDEPVFDLAMSSLRERGPDSPDRPGRRSRRTRPQAVAE